MRWPQAVPLRRKQLTPNVVPAVARHDRIKAMTP